MTTTPDQAAAVAQPTNLANELEDLRRRHWMHWSDANDNRIACAAVEALRSTRTADCGSVKWSPARDLAELVLHMEMVTPKGVRARQLARDVLAVEDCLLHALRLIEHATSPAHDDGGYHEAAHDIASAALAAAPVAQPSAEPTVPEEVMARVQAYGDSRADEDGLSGLRIAEAILAMRRWAAALSLHPAGAGEPAEPAPAMDEVELQEFCISLSFEQDDYTIDVIRAVENRMRGLSNFVPRTFDPGLMGEPTEPSAGKYADVLAPFVSMMEAELHANAGKGDRPGWLTMSRDQALLEIYWHAAKLSAAVKNDNAALIREHSADVANMAMMLLDVCGGLVSAQPAARCWYCGSEGSCEKPFDDVPCRRAAIGSAPAVEGGEPK